MIHFTPTPTGGPGQPPTPTRYPSPAPCPNDHANPERAGDCPCADLAQARAEAAEPPYDHCFTCGEIIEMSESGWCTPCWMREHPRAVSR